MHRLLVVLSTLIVLTACGTAQTPPTASSSATAAAEWAEGLVQAGHDYCGTLGAETVEYLMTGNTNGNASLDEVLAGIRSDLLKQPKAARLGLARQTADKVIDNCDRDAERDAERIAAAASASASASASAAADAAFAKRCGAYGGYVWHIFSYSCRIDYPGESAIEIPLADHAPGLDPQLVAENRQACDDAEERAKQDAADDMSWTYMPKFHPESGVCDPGAL